jgi:hypothetical protein
LASISSIDASLLFVLRHDRERRLEHCGRMTCERRQHRIDREAEHAGVPHVVAGGKVLARLGERGLLDEANGIERVRAVSSDGRAAFDVAESRLGMRGGDAERDERPVLCERRSARHAGHKRRVIADQVIGREYEQDGVAAVSPLRPQRSQRDCGRRVAAERLEEVRRARRQPVAHAGVRILRVEEVLAVGDRDEVGDARDCQRARRGLGKQRLAVGQRHRGFRRRLPRQRPQSRAGAAGEDHRNDAHGRLSSGHCAGGCERLL